MSATPYGIELNRLATRWAEQPTSTCFAPLAEALRKRGALDEAAAVATAGVAAQPAYLPGHLVLARIYADAQRPELAEAELAAALHIDATHPVALEARDELARRFVAPTVATGSSLAGEPPREVSVAVAADPPEPVAITGVADGVEATDDELDVVVYCEQESASSAAGELVLSESLAMLYHGQGHLADAVDVLEALVARTPDNLELVAKRDALRAERDAGRTPAPPAGEGARPVRDWLASLATTRVTSPPAASGLDAFFQTPATTKASTDGDLAAFEAWLRELQR